MGISVVQSKTVLNPSSPAGSFNSATTAGNCVVVLIFTWNGSNVSISTSAVTLGGSAGNFAQAKAVQSGYANSDTQYIGCWADPDCAGGQTAIAATVANGTWGANQGAGLILLELAGVASSSPVDVTASASGTSGTAVNAGTTAATSGAGELAVAAVYPDQGLSGVESGTDVLLGSASPYVAAAIWAVLPAGTQGTYSGTAAASGSWAGLVITLIPAPANGAAVLPVAVVTRPGAAVQRGGGGGVRAEAVTGAQATGVHKAQASLDVAATVIAGTSGATVPETVHIAAGAAQGHSVRSSLVTAAQVTAGARVIRSAGARAAIGFGSTTFNYGTSSVPVDVVITAAAVVTSEPTLLHGAADKVARAGDTMTGPLTVEAPITVTQAVTSGAVVMTWAATITPDAAQGGHFRVTLAGNTTITAPSSPADGQKITLEIAQDGTGGRTVTWGAGFAFGAAGQPALSTSAGARAVLGFAYSAPASDGLYPGSGTYPGSALYPGADDTGAWLYAGAMQGFT